MLITPVVPTRVGDATVPLAVDLSTLYPVPATVTDAKSLFYRTMSNAEAQPHSARPQPESSQAVWEATRWTISLDLTTITVPILCLGATADTIVPPQYVQTLSTMLSHSEYAEYNVGHSDVLLKASGWSAPAARVATFLNAH